MKLGRFETVWPPTISVPWEVSAVPELPPGIAWNVMAGVVVVPPLVPVRVPMTVYAPFGPHFAVGLKEIRTSDPPPSLVSPEPAGECEGTKVSTGVPLVFFTTQIQLATSVTVPVR